MIVIGVDVHPFYLDPHQTFPGLDEHDIPHFDAQNVLAQDHRFTLELLLPLLEVCFQLPPGLSSAN